MKKMVLFPPVFFCTMKLKIRKVKQLVQSHIMIKSKCYRVNSGVYRQYPFHFHRPAYGPFLLPSSVEDVTKLMDSIIFRCYSKQFCSIQQASISVPKLMKHFFTHRFSSYYCHLLERSLLERRYKICCHHLNSKNSNISLRNVCLYINYESDIALFYLLSDFFSHLVKGSSILLFSPRIFRGIFFLC